MLTPSGMRPTPEDDGCVFVLPVVVDVDPDAPLACDWRDGDVWWSATCPPGINPASPLDRTAQALLERDPGNETEHPFGLWRCRRGVPHVTFPRRSVDGRG